jgi:hypothetical protein
MVSRLYLWLRASAQLLPHHEMILARFATIVDMIHLRSHQVYAESSHRAVFDGTREIRLGSRERIERPAIVFDLGGQSAVRQHQTNPDLVRSLIVVTVRDGIRHELVKA